MSRIKPFTTGEKLKLVHQLGLDLEKTDTKLHNRHECECCGMINHVSDQTDPECTKHQAKFHSNTEEVADASIVNPR